MSDDNAELAALDAIVAENDAREDSIARWDAADALYSKAEIIERRDGPAAALEMYREVARRLESVRDDGPRALRLGALHDIATIHEDLGDKAETRSIAEQVISEFFDDPPSEGVEVVVSVTFTLAELLCDEGEYDRTLELMERLIERYGKPGAPGDHVTAAADSTAAGVLGASGKVEEGIQRFERVIRALADPTDVVPRRILANALGKQAQLLYDANRQNEADARCRQLVEQFADDEHPEIAYQVGWARQMLDHSRRDRPRRFRLRR